MFRSIRNTPSHVSVQPVPNRENTYKLLSLQKGKQPSVMRTSKPLCQLNQYSVKSVAGGLLRVVAAATSREGPACGHGNHVHIPGSVAEGPGVTIPSIPRGVQKPSKPFSPPLSPPPLPRSSHPLSLLRQNGPPVAKK